LRAEREQSEFQAELVSARAWTAQARSRLASFFDGNVNPVSIRVQGDFGVAKELPPLPDLLQRALQNRQDYQAENQQQEQLQLEERAATRLRIPDPVFSVGLKRAEGVRGISYGPYIGFSLSVPIFDRGQTRVAELEAVRYWISRSRRKSRVRLKRCECGARRRKNIASNLKNKARNWSRSRRLLTRKANSESWSCSTRIGFTASPHCGHWNLRRRRNKRKLIWSGPPESRS